MRNPLLIFSFIMALCGFSAHAETITIKVNGLVCAFCVNGLQKAFTQQEAVHSTNVSLTDKNITLVTKAPKTLADDTIRSIITESGYSVVAITREK